MNRFRSAPPHNPNFAPAVCLCVECSKIMLGLRCQARDDNGHQCGNYKHSGKEHWMLVATVFQIAEERVALAREANTHE